MLTLSIEGAPAPTASAAVSSAALPPDDYSQSGSNREPVRHMVFGSPHAVRSTILRLHQLGYAEPNDWSRPIATGRTGEVMAILTKWLGSD